jgi:hypothetical protein
MLGKLKEFAYEKYSRYFTFATRVRGTLLATGSPCECLFVMPRDTSVEYFLLGKLFGTNWEKIEQKRIRIASLSRHAVDLPPRAELCVAVLPARWIKAYSKLTPMICPAFLRQTIDMSGDWEDIKGRFLESRKRGVLNKFVREGRFESRITRKQSDFEYFYLRMYLPHTRKQYGREARIQSYEDFKKKHFDRGHVLMIAEDGVDVAGALNVVEGDSLLFLSGGVLDGNDDLVKRGVQTALYVEMLKYAKGAGLQRLDLGLSRPFFSDGVFRYKRAWGAGVSIDSFEDEWIFFFDPANSVNALVFFEQNPMIVTSDGNKLSGLCFAERSAYLDQRWRGRMLSDYYAPGLDDMLFIDAETRTAIRFDFPPR